MTTAQKQWAAELLNRFPMVRWDRWAGQGDHWNVFGWIDRPDGRYDFLVLNLTLPTAENPEGGVGYTTSSARWSTSVPGILYGSAEHIACRRVENDLGALVENVAHL